MPATDSYWRDIKRMHAIFAASAVALFLATIWMMAADHSDEWRRTQATGEKIRAELLSREQESYESDSERQAKREQALADREAAQKELDAKRDELNPLQQQIKAEDIRLGVLGTDLKNAGADRDVARANYGLKVRDGASAEVQQEFLEKFNAQQARVDALQREFDRLNASLRDLRAQEASLKRERDEASARVAEAEADQKRIESALAKVDPQGFAGVKRKMMDWPILDGFNSPTAIKQDWVHIPITIGMAHTDRFDRCRTCHLNIDAVVKGPAPQFPHGETDSTNYIDWVNEGKYPHPFSTHPNVDLYLTSASPHPIETFGCTVCHDGQGSGTSFSNASHTPNDPLIDAEWHDAHHYESNHFWEYPMLPKRLLESTCLKCHHSVVELETSPKFGNSAPQVTEGWHIIKEYGCFGCHEINGYDAGRPIGPDIRLEPQTAEEVKRIAEDPGQVAGTMRKVGPSLRHIASKTTPEFVAHWTELPKRFRPTTRMPQFYHLTNQQDDDAKRYMPVELAGIAQFLFDQSEPMDVLKPEKGYVPNAQRGKELFSQRGCLACHTHSEFPQAKSDFGPNLDRVHAKIPLDKDVELGEVDGKKPNFSLWLYTWIQDPQRYHPRSKMPNLFLSTYEGPDGTIDPAADITAWLLEKGPEDFPEITFPEDGAEIAGGSAESERVAALEDLVRLNLSRAVTRRLALRAQGYESEEALENGQRGLAPQYPIGEAPAITGDEIELVNVATVVDVAEGSYLVEFERQPQIAEHQSAVWLAPAGRGDDDPNAPINAWEGKVTPVASIEKQKNSDRWVVRFDLARADQKKVGTGEGEVPPPRKGDRFYINGRITRDMELSYVGRKTITKYGCYGCHDIPEFEAARPIGTALQDWGRKDPSRLAPEHIAEYLQHHGEPDGESTEERVENSLKQFRAGELTGEAAERERSAAYFYESLLHHGRPGFIWQKLREPRSYDYKMTQTKGYDERLKMPKFPFSEREIQAVSTFVLGLVAEPPPTAYQYRPTGAVAARNQGEILLDKYNCTGCHSVEMGKITVRADLESLPYLKEIGPDEHQPALDLLLEQKPPRELSVAADKEGLGELTFHGSVFLRPDPEEPDPEIREYAFNVWENLKLNGELLRPSARLNITEKNVLRIEPSRGGRFADVLIGLLAGDTQSPDVVDTSWQKAPPTLYKEGIKVQTPWLYRFLKEPYQLRHTTLLRMPKFNMSDEEAQALANYFAAVDGVPFPYQDIPQTQPDYLAAREELIPGSGENGYLGQSWRLLNSGKLCINCHSVGGKEVQVDPTKPAQPRGPNLEYVPDRLRPDWTLVWLYNPKWFTPYTAMPALFGRNKPPDAEILKGSAELQAVGVRDALMNYHQLLERFGRVEAPQTGAPAADEAAGELDPTVPNTVQTRSGQTNIGEGGRSKAIAGEGD